MCSHGQINLLGGPGAKIIAAGDLLPPTSNPSLSIDYSIPILKYYFSMKNMVI